MARPPQDALSDDCLMPEVKTAQVVESHHVYSGRILSLRVDTVRVGLSKPVEREIVEHPGAVVILPVSRDGQLLLVKQHRVPAGAVLLEAPAGHIDPGESPDQAAARELREETGMVAGDLAKLGSFWVAPGWCTEHMHAYLARGLSESRLPQDEDEDVHVDSTPLTKLPALISSGAICDAKTIAAICLLLTRLAPDDLGERMALACDAALPQPAGVTDV